MSFGQGWSDGACIHFQSGEGDATACGIPLYLLMDVDMHDPDYVWEMEECITCVIADLRQEWFHYGDE